MSKPFRLLLPCCILVSAIAWPVTAAETYYFTAARPQAGDVQQHAYQLNVDVEMIIKKDGLLVDTIPQKLERTQQRNTTLVKVADGVPWAAEVTYPNSIETMTDQFGRQPAETRPITGKTYRVVRDGQKLVITDPRGQTPADEELEILEADLESFGKPNPVTQFFHGKALVIGQRLEMPSELVRELVGMGADAAEDSACTMTFEGVTEVAGVDCAILATQIDAKAKDNNKLSMQVAGRLILEMPTCRPVALDFQGPMRTSETRGEGAGQFQLDSRGTLSMKGRMRYIPVAE